MVVQGHDCVCGGGGGVSDGDRRMRHAGTIGKKLSNAGGGEGALAGESRGGEGVQVGADLPRDPARREPGSHPFPTFSHSRFLFFFEREARFTAQDSGVWLGVWYMHTCM